LDETSPAEPQTKTCKECLAELEITRFRVHQRYRDKRSSRCKPCVKERAERKKLKRAMRDRQLEVPRYYWDGYMARCMACHGSLYYDGDEVACRACGEIVTTARQPVPLVLTRLRLLREQGQIA
jgi:hypothetical protein